LKIKQLSLAALFIFISAIFFFPAPALANGVDPARLLEILLEKAKTSETKEYILTLLEQNEAERIRRRSRWLFREYDFGGVSEDQGSVILLKLWRKNGVDANGNPRWEKVHHRISSISIRQIYGNNGRQCQSNFFVIVSSHNSLYVLEDSTHIPEEWLEKLSRDGIDEEWFNEGSPFEYNECIVVIDFTNGLLTKKYGNISIETLTRLAQRYSTNIPLLLTGPAGIIPSDFKKNVERAIERYYPGRSQYRMRRERKALLRAIYEIKPGDKDNITYTDSDPIGEKFRREIDSIYRVLTTSVYPTYIIQQQNPKINLGFIKVPINLIQYYENRQRPRWRVEQWH